ncbi:MAG: hypothetical protein ABJA84_03975 [Polaromonas sp.]
MELTESLKTLFKITAATLKSASRRVFMARSVQELGRGARRWPGAELGWSEWSIRKGLCELASGFVCVDAFHLRGRRAVEARLPGLLDDLRAIVDGQSQSDPQFRTRRLYTRLSVEEVRRQLIAHKGYTSASCPKRGTLRLRLNQLGYYPPARGQDAAKKKRLFLRFSLLPKLL